MGTTGRRLSTVELAVIGSQVHVAPESRLVLTVVGTLAGTVLAGFMVAHVARRGELTHALSHGTILVSALAVTTGYIQADYPAWYRIALPATALPGALLGAFLRTRCRRTPPQAH